MSDYIKITKEDIKHFASLSRIDLGEKENKILKDAQNILKNFEELKKADIYGEHSLCETKDIKNIAAKDIVCQKFLRKGIESFPETEKGYLKTPKIINKETS